MKTAERTAHFNDLAFREKCFAFYALQLGIERGVFLYRQLEDINPKLIIRPVDDTTKVIIHPDSIPPIQKLISQEQDRAVKELINEALAL